VLRKVSRIAIARGTAVTRAPRPRTFASLCSRISCAEKRSVATPARAPGTRLAAIEMPMPLPQTTTPRSARPEETARPTANPKSG